MKIKHNSVITAGQIDEHETVYHLDEDTWPYAQYDWYYHLYQYNPIPGETYTIYGWVVSQINSSTFTIFGCYPHNRIEITIQENGYFEYTYTVIDTSGNSNGYPINGACLIYAGFAGATEPKQMTINNLNIIRRTGTNGRLNLRENKRTLIPKFELINIGAVSNEYGFAYYGFAPGTFQTGKTYIAYMNGNTNPVPGSAGYLAVYFFEINWAWGFSVTFPETDSITKGYEFQIPAGWDGNSFAFCSYYFPYGSASDGGSCSVNEYRIYEVVDDEISGNNLIEI